MESTRDPARAHERCRERLLALVEGEEDLVARMASAAALLSEAVPQASFVGFYRATEDGLVIGPYQGPPACLRIRLGRGVCGQAALLNRSLLVPDVHSFPDHIACDAEARSELVIPIRDRSGKILGVLDLDSREPAAFDEVDQAELERTLALVFGG